MSDELRGLRDAVWELMNTSYGAGTSDEEWYDQLWELLDPVIDARVNRALGTVQDDAEVLDMLAGASFGPNASLQLPSGETLDAANRRVRDVERFERRQR